MLNPNDIYERLVKAGDEWAEAQAAAELLEETKKSVLSQIAADCEEKSMAAKECYALRHKDYKLHIISMVDARKNANRKKVRYDSAKVYADLLRTANANERVAIRSAV